MVGLNGPLGQYCSLYRAVSEREGDRSEKEVKSDRRVKKMSKQPQPAPSSSEVGPYPTITQISRAALAMAVYSAPLHHPTTLGWSGGAMVLNKLPVPGRPTILITVGQGPIALAVGAGGGCLDIFTLLCPFSPFSPSLWETARYRPKYCLKGPLNPKQPTNQHPTTPEL